MKNYKIEKNVPIPDKGFQMLSFIRNLEVGDSFIVSTMATEVNSLRTTAKYYKLKHKFRLRKIKQGQYRIWLISK